MLNIELFFFCCFSIAASADRPASARSIQGGTRQRLQHPSTRRVYAIDNVYPMTTNDSKTSSAETFRLNSTDIESFGIDETRETPITTQNPNHVEIPITTPLRQLQFKKLTGDPVLVGFRFCLIDKKNLLIVFFCLEVAIRCIFLRVGEIDTLNERYYAEILLEATWKEPTFKSLQKRPFDPTSNWTPELELVNGIGHMNDEVTHTVRHDQNGHATVTEHHKLKGILWERMELQHFPLDVQDLSLSITTSRTDSELKFIRNDRKPSGVNRRIFTDEQEWYLFEHVDIEVSEQIDDYLDDGHNHPVVICSCHAAR